MVKPVKPKKFIYNKTIKPNLPILSNPPKKQEKEEKASEKNQRSLKFSIRMDGEVTSVAIPKDICLFYFFVALKEDRKKSLLKKLPINPLEIVKESVYAFIGSFHSLETKGLSSFFKKEMTKRILDKLDTDYKKLYFLF